MTKFSYKERTTNSKKEKIIDENQRKDKEIDFANFAINANFNIERKRKEDEIIINLKIANEKNIIIIDFEIKMYIVVVICNTTFNDKIIDDEIETKTKKNKIETNVENFVDCDFDQLH